MSDEKYSIGKTCQLVGLPQSVLRYWETVFTQLQPEKTPGGTRKYSKSDIELILYLKDLLYTRKFTIAGARKELETREATVVSTQSSDEDQAVIEYIKDEIRSIIRYIDDESGSS